jgi:hypothetical protein
MITPGAIGKLKEGINTFNYNHPRVQPFLAAVAARGITEGSVIELTVKSPDGEAMTSNIKVNQSDLELIELLKSIK